jgi:hypothetical protein
MSASSVQIEDDTGFLHKSVTAIVVPAFGSIGKAEPVRSLGCCPLWIWPWRRLKLPPWRILGYVVCAETCICNVGEGHSRAHS